MDPSTGTSRYHNCRNIILISSSSSRHTHQKSTPVTVAALYILQRRAYDQYSTTNTEDDEHPGSFEDWCSQRERRYPQFQYWTTVLALELSTLIYVRSLREANFSMHLDALTELVPWFFALDHTNYARWIPVHLRDMAELANKHPDVFTEFSNGHFTVQKTKRTFSAIPLDQAHVQNNAYVKGDVGAIGLTDNATALRRWMVAGPEVARVIVEFEDFNMHPRNQEETRHHDETPSVQNTFDRDVRSLVAVIEDDSQDFRRGQSGLAGARHKGDRRPCSHRNSP